MDDAVLIVDGNRARAQRIGEACAARGFSTGFARNGPEALEVALSEVPDVLIAGSDMELIDGPRLEEILRANPRTQDVRFLFLDGKSRGGSSRRRNQRSGAHDGEDHSAPSARTRTRSPLPTPSCPAALPWTTASSNKPELPRRARDSPMMPSW